MFSIFMLNLYYSLFVFEDIVISQDWEITGLLIEEPTWQRLYSVKESQSSNKMIEVAPKKTLRINNSLTVAQEHKLLEILHKNSLAFARNYSYIKGIH